MSALAHCFSPLFVGDVGNLSSLPLKTYDGTEDNVYHDFCDQWVAGTDLTMTVDASGHKKDPENEMLQYAEDPEDYLHVNIDLSFTPSNGDEKCAKECADAFSQISNTCIQTDAEDQLLQGGGSLDVGCGVFDYIITPTTPREVQERQCYGADDFGPHDDIHPHHTRFITGLTCAGTGIIPIKRGDPSTNIVFRAYDKQQPVQMSIYWKDGCILDYPGSDEIFPANPLELDDAGGTFCQDLLADNYEKCNNRGAGGSIQVGCLVYDFRATHD
ncbi:hypothetical protein F4678DRAFT_463738 [Xylaria arbuscula]|nr:hypothetical protein F4678DRAFT_463738 [Xylaria arbuscula]